jgi:hypothetical protein
LGFTALPARGATTPTSACCSGHPSRFPVPWSQRLDRDRETSQTDTQAMGSAGSLRLKNSSQKKPSQYCDTALMRHIRFGMSAPKQTLERVSDTPTTCPVRFPLQPSCCLTACTDPYIRLASACLGRNGPAPSGIAVVVAREFLNNRAVLGSATKIGKRLRHFDENSAKAAGRNIVVRQEHSEPDMWAVLSRG